MDFVITCLDKPGSLALRTANRPAHLDYLKAAGVALKLAGPMLSEDGQPIGSVLVVEAADAAGARAFADEDPYAKAGLFERVTIRPFRPVLGAWVGG
ncbi:MAG TPA: YciI family protein [Geminicoccaceae bacterium]|nr:YciI family protein [Geminicoccaceae bacterium]